MKSEVFLTLDPLGSVKSMAQTYAEHPPSPKIPVYAIYLILKYPLIEIFCFKRVNHVYGKI